MLHRTLRFPIQNFAIFNGLDTHLGWQGDQDG